MNKHTQLTITQPTKPTNQHRHKTRTCPSCHATMITGPDGRAAAIIVDLDPTPLSYPQALACIVTTRRMYTISNSGDIRPHPPNKHLHHPTRYTIYAQHHCRQPIPNLEPANLEPENLEPENLEQPDDGRPPF